MHQTKHYLKKNIVHIYISPYFICLRPLTQLAIYAVYLANPYSVPSIALILIFQENLYGIYLFVLGFHIISQFDFVNKLSKKGQFSFPKLIYIQHLNLFKFFHCNTDFYTILYIYIYAVSVLRTARFGETHLFIPLLLRS